MRDPQIPNPIIDPTALIAPGSHIHGQVDIGPHVFVLFGAVIRAELDRIVVGSKSNIQDNAVLHCDQDIPCEIGREVTVGHSAVVHGATVGDHALIGIGAKVLNRSVVGEGALVAAGSVVLEGATIPSWTLAVGSPARPIRDLTEDEIAHVADGVAHYQQLAEGYREIFANSRS